MYLGASDIVMAWNGTLCDVTLGNNSLMSHK